MKGWSVSGVSCLLAGILATAPAAFGQAVSQISGNVKDQAGAVLPGVEITATRTDTGLVRTTVSNETGNYVLPNLPLGPYKLEAALAGFRTFVQTGIFLQVDSSPVVNPVLEVGQITEQVEVEANATLVETRRSAVGSIIENQRIVELPLNGRNVTDLITLAGSAVSLPAVRQALFLNLYPISVGGQAFYGTDYTLDGAYHRNYLTGTYMPIAFPDAVQEFKVESSGQSAERGSGSSVSVVTKSGTNDVHGDLFYFLRNDGLGSAREYFATKASTYKRNQFGGTVGGPIISNRLFYFAGFQDSIRRENPGNSISTVPTPAMMAGDWTSFASAPCNLGTARVLRAPFMNNQISPSLYAAPSVYITNKLLDALKQDGITPDPCGRITYNTPSDEDDRQYVGKVDYQISTKQSAFVRLLATQQKVPRSFDLDRNLLNWTNTGLDQLANSIAIGDTYLVSANLVHSFRLAFNRTAHRYVPNLAFSYCTAGVKMWCDENPRTIGTMSISGGFTMGSTSARGEHWTGTSYAVNDDLNWVHGTHLIALGGGAWQGRVAEFTHFASTGQLNFNGSVTGLGMADFFLGNLNTLFQGLPNSNATRQNSVNLYFTDAWKATPRLTFNYGLRWEPFLPQTVTNGQISVFDMDRFLKGIKSTMFVNAPAGFYFPGDPGFPGKSATYSRWKQFDPRVGFAWDPTGAGKTSIRAAYSFGYAYVPGITREDQAGSNPWGGRTTITSPPGGLADPWLGYPGGNPFPYTVQKNMTFTPRGQFITTPYDLPTPNTYTWNVSLQRQFGPNWIATASYLGSRVMHLYMNVPINYAVLVNGPIVTTGCAATAINCNAIANTDARRVLSLVNPAEGQYVGNMDKWDPSGTQRYAGMTLNVERKASRGMSMNANWTWSHCTGYFQGYNTKTDQTVTVVNNPLFDRGDCDTDRRHVVNVSGVAQVPRFNNNTLRLIVTGWQLAGIYRFASGTPLAIQDGTDRELNGINHQRPNLVLPDQVYTGKSCAGCQYLTLAAFAPQPLGTVGSLGWNSIVGPRFWGLDMALSRNFQTREKQSLQIRVDAFNVTNSFVPSVPSTANPISNAVPAFVNVSNNMFGQILAAQPTRKLQFALKYAF